MNRSVLVAAVAAGVIAALPAMAQQPPDQAGGRQETVPLRVRDAQVVDLQQKLNDQGFSAGRVDGLWGPNTSAALRRYQGKHGLQQTGQLDQTTMAALQAGAVTPAAPVTQVQDTPATTSPAPAAPPPSAAVTPVPPAPAVTAAPATTPPAPTPPATTPPAATAPATPAAAAPATAAPATTGAAAASGDTNQAVATTSANAPQPAKGANSFTEDQARGRIEQEGYTQVADLKKDGDGVWRGHGTKGGASVGVWLDYKGNVGQQ